MVKSRFLGKPPKARCQRTMIRVGVSDFVDVEAKNARLIAIALNVFRKTFEKDGEQQQEFAGFSNSDCEETANKLRETCDQNAAPYDQRGKYNTDSVMVQPSIISKMNCPKLKKEENPLCELNTANKNTSLSSVVSCLDDSLNYTFAKSCKGGPLNINQTSGEVQCGVCGVIRFYKSIAKTKKYGAYSCDSCRKFIAKSIENQNSINRCNNDRGIGQCRIPNGLKSQNGVTRIVSTDSRCKACWLQMCLKRFKLPESTVQRLLDTLPREIAPVLMWVLKKPDPWTINIGNCLQKKIIREYKLHKEVISALQDDDSDESNQDLYSSENDVDECSDKSDSDMEYNIKKAYNRKKPKLEEKLTNNKIKRKKIKKVEVGSDIQPNYNKRVASVRSVNTATSNLLETKECKYFNKKGPRVKHVCRTAESVLGQTIATFGNVFENSLDDDDNQTLPVDIINAFHHTRSDENMINFSEVSNVKDPSSKCSKMPLPVDNEQDFYVSFQPKRTLQDLMMQDHLNANIDNAEDDKTIDLNFRESYDPDRIAENGFAIVGTEPLSIPRRAVCFLCGSAGMEKLIHCISCCEPYHKFCVDGVGVGISSHESEWSKISWTCPKCKVCKGCQSRGKTRPKLTCQRCKDSYHDHCLVDKIVYDRNRPWACPPCRKCKSCHVPQVDYFVGNLALCVMCFQLRQRGNYCPLCQKCYETDDYETKMMECAVCKHWVHSKCEGLSNEKYEVLSTLPEVIEYVCKNCTTDSTIPWRAYVDEALKSGFMTVLSILGKNKKICDLIKWSPQKQSPGCVCKKLIIPKFPSLDGPNVTTVKTTDEIPKQCVCHGLEGWSKGTPTLVTIKQKVNNNEYDSLCQFNDDMLSTIDKFDVPELRLEYKKIVTDIFPWFSSDFEKNSPRKSSYSSSTLPIISPPKFIPKFSFNLLNSDIKALHDIIGNDENNYYLTPKIDDTRVCQFCKKLGEGVPMREGRLLYCGDNMWAHANCALWSSEVFEEIDGSLQNVQLALSRGKLVRCVVCNEKGASVGCCYRNCVKTYHFQCARKVFCVFNENKTVYCNNHASDTRCSVKDFTLERLIYIEQEDIKQKRKESSEIHILIGSLYISCIGYLHPFLSDSVESIFPINFKAKRYYWSTKEPWKLIQYNWTTKIENYVEKLKFDQLNYTIDHNKQENEIDLTKDDCKQDLDINLFTSIQVDNLEKCYEALKRKCPIDSTFQAKRCKMDSNIDCFAYPNYDTDSEFESTIDETCRMEIFSNSYGLKPKAIPQVDGLYDSSDCESEFEIYQLDNLTDVIDDCTNDQPVKCNRCHRTYRTSLSYERHLVNCNFDYDIDSDSESSDDDKCDKKIEDDCLPLADEVVVQVEDHNIVPQQNYISATQVESEHQQQQQEEPPHTVILQPIHTSFVQPSVSDVQYITINSTPTQSVLPCFQYQPSPTVIVQPPVVDPTTVVLNSPPLDMYVSQSNNLLFSSQPMIVGLDQYTTMSSNYTFTQSPQIYQPTKPAEPITNQYYIINTDPTISNEWSYNITSEIKTERKVVCTQPKVYSNRKLRLTECYDTKENIPNTLVQSVENQVYGVMNIMRNVNPEPWKKPTMKTYPSKRIEQKISPRRIEEKKILPKCVEPPHLFKISTPVNNAGIVKPSTTVMNTVMPISVQTESIESSPVKLGYSSPPNDMSNFTSCSLKSNSTLSSPLKTELKPSDSSVKTLKVLPSQKITKEVSSRKLETFMQQLEKPPQSPVQNVEKKSNMSNVETCSSTLVTDIKTLPSLNLDKHSSTSMVVNKTMKNDEPMEVELLSPSPSHFGNDKLHFENNLSPNTYENILPNNHNVTGDNYKKCSSSNKEITLSIQENSSQIKTQTDLHKTYPERQWSSSITERKQTVPHLMFEMSSADGVFCKDRSLVEIWSKLFDAVQVSRNERKMPQLSSSNPYASDITAAIRSLGLSNNFLKYLLEQLSGAKEFVKYKPVYHKGADVVGSTSENNSGCARTGIVVRKNRYDMFSWLASRHRKPPKLLANNEDFGGRRANSLPNEMKFRNMNKALTTTIGVYRSDIHGRGLFCLRDIEQGEYVIEYTGEVIRSEVSDVRERLYNKKGIDCYMFRIDQDIVVDATMNGNSSRFINHSCEPNCHSKIETIHGKKHIMILAKRKLLQGEELTYDYKFPLEDDKITCHCLSRKCRKYLN
ncbi:histone-lysine N-methyltransferase trithorax isoform X1 [Melanaphis sacchari]|uniref:histone-lysine N-methyltransferase trithorax isoform X1 n=1 Tax=Melanaphis sacchari TaxID=742174 RepID=UPI000DC151F6|nr:histone-lysine N-methyltransferase trithorax isoform X1 [Melanaphis sacchari]